MLQCGNEKNDEICIIIHPDGYLEMFCVECINAFADSLPVGTIVHRIGDDVTHWFI